MTIEQGIGSAYEALLSRIPGLAVTCVGGAMDCCGMGGSLGYKESIHEKTITLDSSVERPISALRCILKSLRRK